MSKLNFDFKDECYVVVGASSGIGKEIALSLANAGAIVLAIGRNEDRLQVLHEQDMDHIVTARVDVTNVEALEESIKNFTQSKGKIKGSVYSAGILEWTPVRSYDHKIAAQIMQIGFWSAMDFLKLIIKSKYSISPTSTVFLSSVAAMTNHKGEFVYSATKAALNSAVKTAAKEIAPKGHRINSICPGWIISPMTENFLSNDDNLKSIEQHHLLGLGKPGDVANIALFLLSDAARWITGTNVVIDGGYTA